MIIKSLLNLIYNVIYYLTLPINIPNLPLEVTGYIDTALDYVGIGVGIISNYTNISYLLILFGLVLAVDVGIGVYKLVMFIIRKIPVLNIS